MPLQSGLVTIGSIFETFSKKEKKKEKRKEEREKKFKIRTINLQAKKNTAENPSEFT